MCVSGGRQEGRGEGGGGGGKSDDATALACVMRKRRTRRRREKVFIFLEARKAFMRATHYFQLAGSNGVMFISDRK